MEIRWPTGHLAIATLLGSVSGLVIMPDPPGRVVALGDLHGDLQAAERVLKLAGIIDDSHSWVGGDATLVQLGDLLDRGAEEQGVWDLFQRLRDEAPQSHGRVIRLIGNHEVLNVLGKAGHYIHPRGHEHFGGDRCSAFRPGGQLAMELAEFPVVAIVGDSIFAHASLPEDATVKHLEELNVATKRWIQGKAGTPVALLGGRNSPVWDRTFSCPNDIEVPEMDCNELRRNLDQLGVSRLVIGHTPQDAVNCACEGAVWRCDTGQSRWVMGGACEALEILDGRVRVISTSSLPRTGGAELVGDIVLTSEDALDDPICSDSELFFS